jgi:hypothetical protein
MMDKITHSSALLEWHKTNPNSTRFSALSSFPFDKLPAELFFLVTSFLPAESVACLALTCRPLYTCIEDLHLKITPCSSRKEPYMRIIKEEFEG